MFLQTCTGAVACQLMDCLHPGSVNMKKVDFNVRTDYEFVNNYKELQQAFNKLGVERAFNVNQLSKGKRQDNNEFMQWFKGYWDSVSGGQDLGASYDAVARRNICKTGDWKKFSLGDAAQRPTAPRPTSSGGDAPIPAVRPARVPTPAQSAPASAPRGPTASKAAVRAALRPAGKDSKEAPIAAELAAKLAEITEQVTEMKLKVEVAERERDFYFDKLRDIEILCQAPELADVPVSISSCNYCLKFKI